MTKFNCITKFKRKIQNSQHKYTCVNSPEECNTSTFIPVRYITVFVIVLSCAVDYITRVSNESQ